MRTQFERQRLSLRWYCLPALKVHSHCGIPDAMSGINRTPCAKSLTETCNTMTPPFAMAGAACAIYIFKVLCDSLTVSCEIKYKKAHSWSKSYCYCGSFKFLVFDFGMFSIPGKLPLRKFREGPVQLTGTVRPT